MVTTDAGLKRFATDGPKPRIARGAPDGAVYGFSGDEHGCIVFSDPVQTLPIGAAVECVVPHCDPTVNLYDHFHCVRGDTLVDLWPVDARGAF
jgi:D-serine deaminase-like pyridoxal phosphate-dependent protein